MRFSIARPLGLVASLAALISPTVADNGQMLESTSLNSCQDNSGFTARLFSVVFNPSTSRIDVNITAVSSISSHVIFDVTALAYGYSFYHTVINPCEANSAITGFCPMTAANQVFPPFSLQVPPDQIKNIPGIAYTFPDLDAKVRLLINATDGPQANQTVACVEADISNGKTVDLLGVKWATAVIAGLALAASAVISGLGHSNTASHVAANALSLFGYFQAQAMIGLCGVPLPPVVQSWTQDFQWSMGIINVGFMQTIFTWYQRATGGTPSTLFNTLTTTSVQVEKRSLAKRSLEAAVPVAMNLYKRSVAMMPRAAVEIAQNTAGKLWKRGNIQTGSGAYIVYGIQRVAFRAYIESTNLFMTGLTFFCIFVVLTIICVAAFKGILEIAARNKWMKHDQFLEFRNGWFTVLKGILFRLTLIGFPQMAILCLWEFTQVDSAAEVVLAVFFLFGMLITLSWAASKVIRIARRSVAMHRNPAYILFSDPQALNKWGFLYVQFRASAYYYILPILVYTLVKGMFIALAQGQGTVQAIALIIIEAAFLIAASVLRPWMDKSINSFNIAICAVNFFNAICLLVYTDVFNQPAIVTAVFGVVFWIVNAAFSLILLILLIVTTIIVFFRKNPDNRYQFMADDRASFMKSQTQLTTTTELDALAATARGDKAGGFKQGLDMDDDNESISSEEMRRRTDPTHMPLPPSTANSAAAYRDGPPRSPVDPSMPLYPGNDGRSRGLSPARYDGSGYAGSSSASLRNQSPAMGRAPSPYTDAPSYRQQNNASPAGFRSQNAASPWQRGAGYDHQ